MWFARADFAKDHPAIIEALVRGFLDATDTHVVWRYEKFTPFCASPLFYDGRIFIIKDGGILTCIDAKTGQPKKSGRVTGTTNYYASPAGGDGKVYLLSQRGTLSVISADDRWEVLHSAEFGAPISAFARCLIAASLARTALFAGSDTGRATDSSG